jgi:hypothetical protein
MFDQDTRDRFLNEARLRLMKLDVSDLSWQHFLWSDPRNRRMGSLNGRDRQNVIERIALEQWAHAWGRT